VLFTVGHSTHDIDDFLALLAGHGVARVVDVRRFPGSRRHPQFGQEALAAALRAAGVEYRWLVDLGGRRSRARGAPPSAWRVAAFAAYGDHVNTPPFRAAAAELLALAASSPTAVMCAEAFPYQCHRRLISDFAELYGTPVEHILTSSRRERHRVTPFARRVGDEVRYDPEAAQPELPLVGPTGGAPG
jgi:uncharacterized protein (DUF488 family)